MSMKLADRLKRLEASAPMRAGTPFCASPKNQSHGDCEAIAGAVERGYWDRLAAHPVVAKIHATPIPTAEQWATVGRIARELMATEAPDPNDSGLTALAKF